MSNSELMIKRLALIKQLYKVGIEQSKQFETLASFSVLTFHDSIEMFLKLLSEHKNIKSEKFNFLDYWTSIPELTLKESMKSLNSRRVNIKHKGLLPSKSDIEISRVNTTDFLNQNSKIFFNIDFENISLVELVDFIEVKKYLIKAQSGLDNYNWENCIENSAIAFYQLLYEYENNKIGSYINSPFYFGKDFHFHTSFTMGIKDNKKLAQFVDRVGDSIGKMQQAIKITSLGIDYKRYVKFKLLTPIITRTTGGIFFAELWNKKKWTKENCQYCIDFVIESSLKLQEFNFDIQDIEEDIDGFFTLEKENE
ncbi:MAG: hypothetical protein ACTHJT_08900 [Cytophaga sp.]|uniref:hypothetical protein n=1 Tax=Cytophaga sp. TaxID=29535 RepID=UPI003F7CD938